MDDRTPTVHWEIALHDDIGPLEPTWREIEARGCSTAFQSFDWLATWYEVVGRHGAAEPVIVAARHAGADEVQAILPLCRIRRRGYWEISFADLAVGDFAGPVFLPEAFVRPGASAALMDAVVRALPKADVIRLDKLCTTIGGRPNPLLDLADVVPFPVGVWGLTVDADTVSKPPPGAKRWLFAKAEKLRSEIAAKFDQTFEWCEGPDRLPTIFETLLDLRIARFEPLGRPDLLKEAMWRDFYRAMAARPDSTETLRSADVPALVVVGEEDTLTRVDEAHAMVGALPNATLEIIPEAGHLSPLENPAMVAEAILSWLPPRA
jgi:CelD/BcsL family acetyltransferase involved in cellulose biosynthesis